MPSCAANRDPRRCGAVTRSELHQKCGRARNGWPASVGIRSPRSITGRDVSGGREHAFDDGTFGTTVVELGELRTDGAGRLLVLGGRGRSGSPSGAPIYVAGDASSFANADDWFDDVSDGPVTAEVSIDGRPIPTAGAWVAVAPPNYAPDVIG